MQRIEKTLNCILMCILIVCMCAGCTNSEIIITTAFGPTELMRINDESCYLPEMMLYLTTVQNKYEQVYASKLWEETKDGKSIETMVKDMVLAKVAQVKVMNLMARSYNLELTEAELNNVLSTSRDFYASLNDTERELIGVSEEDIIRIYKEYALANKVYDYVIRDVNPEISDDEARTITVLQILIKTYALNSEGKRVDYTDRMKKEAYEKAQMIEDLLETEEYSFESLAAKYNEGDQMTITFMRGELDPAFEEAAFNLDKDQVSGIIETEYGYHIAKCVSDFDVNVTQQNKVEILDKRREEVFDETYNEFLTTLTKTMNERLYNSISMIHNENVTTTSFFDVDF